MIKRIRLPRVSKGMRRQFVKCKVRSCGRVSFYDYIPYGISPQLLSTPCGHGIGARDYNLKDITESEYRVARAKELARAQR